MLLLVPTCCLSPQKSPWKVVDGKTVCSITGKDVGMLGKNPGMVARGLMMLGVPMILYSIYVLSFGEYTNPDRLYVLAQDNWRAKDSRLPEYKRERGDDHGGHGHH